MTEKKTQKDISLEFEKVLDAISEWRKVNKDNVTFVASFVKFGSDGEVIDEDLKMLAFGSNNQCRIQLEELDKALKEEEKYFVIDF